MRSNKIAVLNLISLSLVLCAPCVKADDAVGQETAAPAVKKPQSKKTKPKTKKKAGSTGTVQIQEDKDAKKKSSVQVWLSKLKKKMAASQSKNNKLVAVAAVRGDETSDSPPLYWKGKSSEGPVQLPELKEFDDAINLALNGDNAGAKLKLENFIATYPNSHMMDDAQQTLKMLSEEPIAP